MTTAGAVRSRWRVAVTAASLLLVHRPPLGPSSRAAVAAQAGGGDLPTGVPDLREAASGPPPRLPSFLDGQTTDGTLSPGDPEGDLERARRQQASRTDRSRSAPMSVRRTIRPRAFAPLALAGILAARRG